MNKIIVNFGMLVFFLSIVIFSQKGLMIQDILIRSAIIFVVVTIMFSVLALAFVKAVNKTASEKQTNTIHQKLAGSGDNE